MSYIKNAERSSHKCTSYGKIMLNICSDGLYSVNGSQLIPIHKAIMKELYITDDDYHDVDISKYAGMISKITIPNELHMPIVIGTVPHTVTILYLESRAIIPHGVICVEILNSNGYAVALPNTVTSIMIDGSIELLYEVSSLVKMEFSIGSFLPMMILRYVYSC